MSRPKATAPAGRVTMAEAAELAGVSKSAVQRRIADGTVPARTEPDGVLTIARGDVKLIEPRERSARARRGGAYNILNQFRSGGERGIPCLAGRTNDRVQTAACTDSFTDQFWQLVPAPASGFFRLVVQIDGRCMAFPNGSNGSETRMSTCVDSFDDQWWRFAPTLDSNRFLIRNFRIENAWPSQSGIFQRRPRATLA